MIKKTELRIGNIVLDAGGVEKTILQLFDDTFQGTCKNIVGIYTYDYSSGIPLTEEWLVRMGFKERHIYEEVSEWNLGPYRIQTNVEFYIWMGIGDGVELKFVHQLQNLYFALTGEELKLA